MKIGVLSDTHVHDLTSANYLAELLLGGAFSTVEAILHAGDAVIPELESCFYPLPWFAVRGNMDQGLMGTPIRRIVELAGKRIGMVHGWGAPTGIEQRVLGSFMGQDLDALIFGHSHQPVCRKVGNVLLFNPGSATDRRQAARHTVGVLTIESGISGEIIPLD